MKIKAGKKVRHIKVKDKLYAELKKQAIDSRTSLQDLVNIILEAYIVREKIKFSG